MRLETGGLSLGAGTWRYCFMGLGVWQQWCWAARPALGALGGSAALQAGRAGTRAGLVGCAGLGMLCLLCNLPGNPCGVGASVPAAVAEAGSIGEPAGLALHTWPGSAQPS